MKQNKYYSYSKGKLCEGCKLCVKGRKTVIYITGICPKDCFYCPLSEEKKNKDVIFANEKKVSKNKVFEDISKEIDLCGSKGVGITGGDPLVKLDRTLNLIKGLKKRYGKNFHIHLYTSLELLNEIKVNELYNSGLDELRVHPNLYDKSIWDKIFLLKYFKGKKGIEVPAIPGRAKIIKEIYNYSKDKIDFLNINEFEYSDNNCERLHKQGFFCRDDNSYAIKGSKELGLRLINVLDGRIPVHFCTAKLKDATQISNRLKLRALNVKKKYDIVNEEGLLVRGVIRGDFKKINENLQEFKVPKDLFERDNDKVLIAAWVLEDIYRILPFRCEIIIEYPTADRMVVDVIPLNKNSASEEI